LHESQVCNFFAKQTVAPKGHQRSDKADRHR
jgi:hypothetical protein